METKLLGDRPQLFDHYVSTHPHGDLLQTTSWGQLKACSGWDWYPLAVLEKGLVRGTALLLAKKLPYFPGSLFYSPRGPLFSSPQALKALWDAGRDLARRKGALVWKMDPALPLGKGEWASLAREHKLRLVPTGLDFAGVQPRFVMVLDLQKNLERLLEDMKSKTRYNIRYAQRKGVRILQVQEKGELDTFYNLLQETAQRENFLIRPLLYFQSIWDHLVSKKMAQFFLAYHQETPLAAALAFRLGKKVWYVYGASANQKRNLQAAHLIQWALISWAKGLGCHTYDFRGVSGDLNPENPLYGLYRFKEGFGARLREYVGEYDLPISRGGYALWQKGWSAHQQLKTKKKSLF